MLSARGRAVVNVRPADLVVPGCQRGRRRRGRQRRLVLPLLQVTHDVLAHVVVVEAGGGVDEAGHRGHHDLLEDLAMEENLSGLGWHKF